MSRSTEGWFAAFTRAAGCAKCDATLLRIAAEGMREKPCGGDDLEDHLEISFGSGLHDALGYAVRVEPLSCQTVDRMVQSGLSAIDKSAGSDLRGPFDVTLARLWRELGTQFPPGLGAEHAADGSVTRFKTYWYCSLPSEQLGRLVAPDHRAAFAGLARVARAYWPEWDHVRGIGVDFRRGGGTRTKIYLPDRDHVRPLTLHAFGAYLASLGWTVRLQALPILAHFVLAGQTEIAPSAYSFSMCIDDPLSIKLGIVMEPYAPDTERALYALQGVAEAFQVDPSSLLDGFDALARHGPRDRAPRIEVLALDFYSDGHCDMTAYCRLLRH